MNHRKKHINIAAWIILALSVCVMATSGYQLREIQQIYQIGEEAYNELSDLVRPEGLPVFREPQTVTDSFSEPESGTELAVPGEFTEQEMKASVEIPYAVINFGALQKVNPDAVAWLYGPDTPIDYPVVRAKDYDYYLRHLPDGTYNANGTLFIDYNWVDFSDQLMIIYGHNMRGKSESMFGSLANYKKQAYFEKNPYLYLYTAESGNYRVELMHGCVIGEGQWRERAFMFDLNLDSLLAYAAYNTTFTSEVRYGQGDKIIVLATCSDEFDGARYVLIGVLRPEQG